MSWLRRSGTALAIALLLAGCGAPTVAPYMRPPRAPRGQTPAGNISVARAHWNILANPGRRSEWAAAQDAYNLALTAAFDDLRRADDDWTRATAATGTRIAKGNATQLDPNLLGAVFPASKVRIKQVGPRCTIPGLGLPVVGWIDEGTALYERQSLPPPSGVSVDGTALLRFDRGPTPTWEFRHPYHRDKFSIAGVEHPIAADWSAARSLYWHMSALDSYTVTHVLRPDRIPDTEGLFFVQPLDRTRIPVVFIHGLTSSPHAFSRMINGLFRESWFRENFQVWYYSYSTGNPWLVSAARFRNHLLNAFELARSQGVQSLDRSVIVGHSMGGLITQASLREVGDSVYRNYFNQAPEALDLRPDERRLIERTLIWKPLPHVSRAIFLATPHRGSPMADARFSRALSEVIKLPKTLTVDLTDGLIRNTAAIADPTILTPEERLSFRTGKLRMPNVIDSLSPRQPVFDILHKTPFRDGLHLHSVIGDRGLGNSPDSSDGVVPYWSAHLPEADSETIVPAWHIVNRTRSGAIEVKRLLRLHLDE